MRAAVMALALALTCDDATPTGPYVAQDGLALPLRLEWSDPAFPDVRVVTGDVRAVVVTVRAGAVDRRETPAPGAGPTATGPLLAAFLAAAAPGARPEDVTLSPHPQLLDRAAWRWSCRRDDVGHPVATAHTAGGLALTLEGEAWRVHHASTARHGGRSLDALLASWGLRTDAATLATVAALNGGAAPRPDEVPVVQLPLPSLDLRWTPRVTTVTLDPTVASHADTLAARLSSPPLGRALPPASRERAERLATSLRPAVASLLAGPTPFTAERWVTYARASDDAAAWLDAVLAASEPARLATGELADVTADERAYLDALILDLDASLAQLDATLDDLGLARR